MGSDQDNFLFDTVAVVGVGLIGGSLGMAARRRLLARRVIGIGRSEAKLMRAQVLGAVDAYTLDFENGAAEADLVFICTPVRTIVPTLDRLADSLKEGAIVSDVGSTKAEVVRQASAVMPDGRCFVGGHPMAGSEQAGVEAAIPDLFLGATYVLTPGEEINLGALGKMAAFAEGLGANVEIMTPEEHDKAVAVISHLPHVMAAALVQLAEGSHRESGKTFRLAAGAFRDLTRISDSPPEIWRDICLTNAGSLREAVMRLRETLEQFERVLESGDEEAVEAFFRQAAEIRQTYLRIAR